MREPIDWCKISSIITKACKTIFSREIWIIMSRLHEKFVFHLLYKCGGGGGLGALWVYNISNRSKVFRRYLKHKYLDKPKELDSARKRVHFFSNFHLRNISWYSIRIDGFIYRLVCSSSLLWKKNISGKKVSRLNNCHEIRVIHLISYLLYIYKYNLAGIKFYCQRLSFIFAKPTRAHNKTHRENARTRFSFCEIESS